MHQRIDVDVLWQRAVRQAALDLAEQRPDHPLASELRVLGGMPCPLSLTDILADPADPDELVRRLTAALAR
jgi:hypothetical protein